MKQFYNYLKLNNYSFSAFYSYFVLFLFKKNLKMYSYLKRQSIYIKLLLLYIILLLINLLEICIITILNLCEICSNTILNLFDLFKNYLKKKRNISVTTINRNKKLIFKKYKIFQNNKTIFLKKLKLFVENLYKKILLKKKFFIYNFQSNIFTKVLVSVTALAIIYIIILICAFFFYRTSSSYLFDYNQITLARAQREYYIYSLPLKLLNYFYTFGEKNSYRKYAKYCSFDMKPLDIYLKTCYLEYIYSESDRKNNLLFGIDELECYSYYAQKCPLFFNNSNIDPITNVLHYHLLLFRKKEIELLKPLRKVIQFTNYFDDLKNEESALSPGAVVRLYTETYDNIKYAVKLNNEFLEVSAKAKKTLSSYKVFFNRYSGLYDNILDTSAMVKPKYFNLKERYIGNIFFEIFKKFVKDHSYILKILLEIGYTTHKLAEQEILHNYACLTDYVLWYTEANKLDYGVALDGVKCIICFDDYPRYPIRLPRVYLVPREHLLTIIKSHPRYYSERKIKAYDEKVILDILTMDDASDEYFCGSIFLKYHYIKTMLVDSLAQIVNIYYFEHGYTTAEKLGKAQDEYGLYVREARTKEHLANKELKKKIFLRMYKNIDKYIVEKKLFKQLRVLDFEYSIFNLVFFKQFLYFFEINNLFILFNFLNLLHIFLAFLSLCYDYLLKNMTFNNIFIIFLLISTSFFILFTLFCKYSIFIT